MSSCSNKKFKDMIHHYELGLLSDSDRDALELHFLDCDECYTSYSDFRQAARQLRENNRVQDAIADLSGPSFNLKQPNTSPRQKFPIYIPALVFAVAIIILVILKPWHVEFHSSQDVSANDNRIAVLQFENLEDETDANRLGEILSELLITDLTESSYLQTVTSQRLRNVQLETQQSSDRYREIASRVHASWVLTGMLLQSDPVFIVSTQLIDARTGNTVSSRRIVGNNSLDLYSIVDSISNLVIQDMVLPSEALAEEETRIAPRTTHSLDAYRFYLEGIDNQNKYYREDAINSYKKALEYDSTFAMVYYYLSDLEDSSHIDRALQYSDNIGWRENMYIQAKYYMRYLQFPEAISQLEAIIERDPEDKTAMYFLGGIYQALGENNSALSRFLRLLDIDPLDKKTYNTLAYLYNDLGDADSSIWAINKYIELAPNEANPYDSRGDLYATNGKVNEAIASFRQALTFKPDFFNSLEKLGHMHVFIQDYKTADSCYRVLTQWKQPAIVSRGYNHQAYIPLYQGKFTEALEIVDRNIQLDKDADLLTDMAHSLHLKALILDETGRPEEALTIMEECIAVYKKSNPENKTHHRDFYIRLLAKNGQYEVATAQSEALKVALTKSNQSLAHYWFTEAMIARYQGMNDSALACIKRYSHESDLAPNLNRRFYKARILFETDHLAKAVTEFESITKGCGSIELYWGIHHTLSYYYLGRVYEVSNWNDRAIEQYQIFIDRWQDSDYPGLELEDAKKRFVRLTSRAQAPW